MSNTDSNLTLLEEVLVAIEPFLGYNIAHKAFNGDPVEIGNQLRGNVCSYDFKKLEELHKKVLEAYETYNH